MEIKQLTGTSIQIIHAAFEKAFSDYTEPFDLSVSDLAYMIERRGYSPELSFGAFADGELVGFTLNGVGDWNGKRTASIPGPGLSRSFGNRESLRRYLMNHCLC